ncbi:MAG: YceI family protein [Acidobacteria bacterium]|nr:YceI family protein [Acidobacteriota bacterium]
MRGPRAAPIVVLALACLQAAAAVPAAGAMPAAGGARTLPIDPASSALTFTIHRPGETIEGRAREFAGEVGLNPVDLAAGGSVTLRIVASALETGNRMRDRKMRGSYLEVERYPEILFKSISIKVGPERERSESPPATGTRGAERGGTQRRALVEGVLSLHGVDRTLLVPAAIRYDTGTLTAEGSVTLRYSDHGIPVPRFLWLVMDDEIVVRFRFVAGPAAP